jgi:hypothetical protein
MPATTDHAQRAEACIRWLVAYRAIDGNDTPRRSSPDRGRPTKTHRRRGDRREVAFADNLVHYYGGRRRALLWGRDDPCPIYRVSPYLRATLDRTRPDRTTRR